MKTLFHTLLMFALIVPALYADEPLVNMPVSNHKNIVEVASDAGNFDTLIAAVQAAGLVETLSSDGPLTVFAPTDEAFAQLGLDTVEELLLPENRDKLTAILTYHVVAGRIEASDLLGTTRAKTVNGTRLPIGLSIGNANIIQTDIEASNGIIHVIDQVLVPEQLPATLAGAALIIRTAIDRGVPLYNRGQPQACASVYEVAARAILQLDANIPDQASRPLKRALGRIERTHDQDEKAWILREGLDKSLAALRSSRMTKASNSL